MAYLLNTNVFIEAKNRYYDFDLCPGFWEWLDIANTNGRIRSIEAVLNEVEAFGDDLRDWARDRRQLFPRLEPELAPSLQNLSAWTNSGFYTPGAVVTFLDAADYFLVGSAMASGDTVVTLERAEQRPGRIKIPDACLAIGSAFHDAVHNAQAGGRSVRTRSCMTSDEANRRCLSTAAGNLSRCSQDAHRTRLDANPSETLRTREQRKPRSQCISGNDANQ